MDFAAPPAVVEALVERARHGIYGYPLRTEAFYQSLIQWFAGRHGWRIRKDWIVPLSGVVPAIHLAVQAFSEAGDGVLIQPPVYYPFFDAVRDNGRRIVANALKMRDRRCTIDFAGLERALDRRCRVLIFCSPHNPVGRVWRVDELGRLAEICQEHDLLVVSDEIHCDIVLPGHRHTVLASLSPQMAERTVTCISPSKTFNLAGLSTAYVVIADENLRRRFRSALAAVGGDLGNVFGLTAAQTAYESGEEWLDQLLLYLAGNYRFLKDFIGRRIPEVQVFPLEGTYLAWLDFRRLGMSREDLDDLLIEKAGVWLDDGAIFGDSGGGFQRINIACPRSVLEEALSRIDAALHTAL